MSGAGYHHTLTVAAARELAAADNEPMPTLPRPLVVAPCLQRPARRAGERELCPDSSLTLCCGIDLAPAGDDLMVWSLLRAWSAGPPSASERRLVAPAGDASETAEALNELLWRACTHGFVHQPELALAHHGPLVDAEPLGFDGGTIRLHPLFGTGLDLPARLEAALRAAGQVDGRLAAVRAGVSVAGLVLGDA